MGSRVTRNLSNGPECLFIRSEEPGREGVVGVALIRAGSGSDPVGKKGLAHVVEHYVGGGIEDVVDFMPDKIRFAHSERRVIFGARTHLDYTRYHFGISQALHSDLFTFVKNWLDGFSRRTHRARKSVAEVVAEKKAKQKQTVFARAFDLLYGLNYDRHPYAPYTVGRLADVRRITPRDCREFVAKHYVARNVTLAFAISCSSEGDFHRIAEEAAKILESANLLQGPRAPSFSDGLPSAPPIAAGFRVRVDRPAKDSRPALTIGIRAPSGGRDRNELRIVAHLLLGRGSPFRTAAGPYLAALASHLPLTAGEGLLEVMIALKPGSRTSRAERVFGTFLDECHRLSAGRFRRAEFERAVANHLRSLEDSGDPEEFRLTEAAAYRLFGLDWWQDATLARETSFESIRAAAKRYLDPDRMAVVYSP